MILREKLLMTPNLSPGEQQAFVRRHKRRCRHVVDAYILQIFRGQEGWVPQAGNGDRAVLYSVVERRHDAAPGLPPDRWKWPTDIPRRGAYLLRGFVAQGPFLKKEVSSKSLENFAR